MNYVRSQKRMRIPSHHNELTLPSVSVSLAQNACSTKYTPKMIATREQLKPGPPTPITWRCPRMDTLILPLAKVLNILEELSWRPSIECLPSAAHLRLRRGSKSNICLIGYACVPPPFDSRERLQKKVKHHFIQARALRTKCPPAGRLLLAGI